MGKGWTDTLIGGILVLLSFWKTICHTDFLNVHILQFWNPVPHYLKVKLLPLPRKALQSQFKALFKAGRGEII